MKAINAEGMSDRSRFLNVETPQAPDTTDTTLPATPTGLTASSVAHDSVTLTWDDPADDSITGYQVLRRSRDGAEHGDGQGAAEFVAVVDDTGSPATTYTDTSVAPHTRYVYRVKAINAEGMSDRSRFLNVETPQAPDTAGTTLPATPTGLTAPSVAHDSVTLTWDDPADSTVTGYQVLRRSGMAPSTGTDRARRHSSPSSTTPAPRQPPTRTPRLRPTPGTCTG